MCYMSDFDWSGLDAKILRVLVTVVDTGSVTGAAQHLDVTQSAVSHQLDKLRAIVRDPLFVKSGRGIVATARAELLAERARELLRNLEQFAHLAGFDPARWNATVTVAANDFQRDVLLPGLVARLRTTAPGLRLRVIPSGVPTPAELRGDRAQLVISPRPPEGGDVMHRPLFEDRYRVFFDPRTRAAPRGPAEYFDSEHITVVYDPPRRLGLDEYLEERGSVRSFRVTVPGFAAMAAFLRGSDLLATAPGLLRHHVLQGFADTVVPVACPTLPMYLIWHRRYESDPAHEWLRRQVLAVSDTVGAEQGGGPAGTG